MPNIVKRIKAREHYFFSLKKTIVRLLKAFFASMISDASLLTRNGSIWYLSSISGASFASSISSSG